MAHLYNNDPTIQVKLNYFKEESNTIVEQSASNLIEKAFKKRWLNFNRTIDASASSETMNIDVSSIKTKISEWIAQMETYRETEVSNYNKDEFKEAMPVKQKHNETLNDIDTVIYQFNQLKNDVDNVENEFSTTTTQYRSPLRQAMNDITLLYNEIEGIEGVLSGYKNVSVYLHGIEDTGKDFFETAFHASEKGDILVHEKRNGDIEYFLVKEENNEKHYEKLSDFDDKDPSKRLHYIYETQHKNEHRQDTSDQLTESLIDQGVLSDETKIDMFGHSYGGRRSLQFAIDYPEYVRSLTTIGTPYDKNSLASTANSGSKVPFIKDFVTGAPFNKHAHENSNYLDFNESHSRTDKNMNHSNAYTDMTYVSMEDTVDQIQVANPETYKLIENMDITAVAGRDVNTFYVTTHPYIDSAVTIPSTSDGAVSVKSQRGDVLGDLVDQRYNIDVEGEGIFGVPHSQQIKNPIFQDLVDYVNKEQKE